MVLCSIEYWPDPQRGIKEAYRVLRFGGLACVIGPVYPTFWLSRFFADMWMLFPKEEEYIEWFKKAGFRDVKLKRIGPKWYRGVRRHGLIMGCSVTGVKRERGDSPLEVPFPFHFANNNGKRWRFWFWHRRLFIFLQVGRHSMSLV
jgi:MPBQ/MSBQ methyltransferase